MQKKKQDLRRSSSFLHSGFYIPDFQYSRGVLCMTTNQSLVLSDCYGLPITTHSHEALEWYNRGIHGLLGFRSDAPECFLKALALDPELKMAQSHLGMCYFMEESAQMIAKAHECFTQSCLDLEKVTDRERDVLETVLMWAQGRSREWLDRMQAAIRARPREASLIQRIYFVYFMQGGVDKMLELMESALPAYDNDSYILGMYSFALEEARNFAKALEIGHKARALNSEDIWTVHALTHVYYETGAFGPGTQLLTEALPQCEGIGSFRTHIAWHLAVLLWEQGQYQKALGLYHDRFPRPDSLGPPTFVDAVALLWRLNLAGQPTPAEWEALTPSLEQMRALPTYLFNQMHVALGLAGAKKFDWAQAYLEGLRARVKPDRPGVLGEVGVPLVEGLVAYARGDYARTVDCILPIKDRISNIGGSHAQRAIFSDILIDACLRSGVYDVAVELLEAKRRFCSNRPLALLGLEKAYVGKGNAARAAEVGALAKRLWREMGAEAEQLM
jgi:tetratricopeptide (TPR) repeat protein